MRALTPEEIADIGAGARSLSEFRRAALERLRWIGFDGAVLQSFEKSVPPDYRAIVDVEPRAVERIRDGFDRYTSQLAPFFSGLRARGHGSLGDFFDGVACERLAIVNEVYRPYRLGRPLHFMLRFPSMLPATLCLVRSGLGARFRDTELHILCGLMPALTLAHAAWAQAERNPLAPRLIPSERELVDYVALGLTNQQIALALARSPNTVRNRLARLFEKLGVANRAELVALARRTSA